jgi:hypothetical protein
LPTSTDLEFPACADLNFSNRPVRTRTPGGVGGVRSSLTGPYPDFGQVCWSQPRGRRHGKRYGYTRKAVLDKYYALVDGGMEPRAAVLDDLIGISRLVLAWGSNARTGSVGRPAALRTVKCCARLVFRRIAQGQWCSSAMLRADHDQEFSRSICRVCLWKMARVFSSHAHNPRCELCPGTLDGSLALAGGSIGDWSRAQVLGSDCRCCRSFGAPGGVARAPASAGARAN